MSESRGVFSSEISFASSFFQNSFFTYSSLAKGQTQRVLITIPHVNASTQSHSLLGSELQRVYYETPSYMFTFPVNFQSRDRDL